MAATKPTAPTPRLQPSPRRAGAAAAYALWWISDSVDFADECWVWTGATTAKGYGVLHLKNYDLPQSTVHIHRLVYEICVEPIPEGLCVLHKCDNPPCCRPEHLFLGTNLDNIEDKMSKGRHASPKGESHGRHKLTADRVMDIRRRAFAGETLASISRSEGICDSHISAIVLGKVWSHLPVMRRDG